MMNLAEYRHSNARLADFLPWAALVDEGIILNKDGSFQRTAKFRGPDLDSAVPAELVAVAGRLNNALRRLGSGWAVSGFGWLRRHTRAIQIFGGLLLIAVGLALLTGLWNDFISWVRDAFVSDVRLPI